MTLSIDARSSRESCQVPEGLSRRILMFSQRGSLVSQNQYFLIWETDCVSGRKTSPCEFVYCFCYSTKPRGDTPCARPLSVCYSSLAIRNSDFSPCSRRKIQAARLDRETNSLSAVRDASSESPREHSSVFSGSESQAIVDTTNFVFETCYFI